MNILCLTCTSSILVLFGSFPSMFDDFLQCVVALSIKCVTIELFDKESLSMDTIQKWNDPKRSMLDSIQHHDYLVFLSSSFMTISSLRGKTGITKHYILKKREIRKINKKEYEKKEKEKQTRGKEINNNNIFILDHLTNTTFNEVIHSNTFHFNYHLSFFRLKLYLQTITPHMSTKIIDYSPYLWDIATMWSIL